MMSFLWDHYQDLSSEFFGKHICSLDINWGLHIATKTKPPPSFILLQKSNCNTVFCTRHYAHPPYLQRKNPINIVTVFTYFQFRKELSQSTACLFLQGLFSHCQPFAFWISNPSYRVPSIWTCCPSLLSLRSTASVCVWLPLVSSHYPSFLKCQPLSLACPVTSKDTPVCLALLPLPYQKGPLLSRVLREFLIQLY